MAFSYDGLIAQLKFEGYSDSEAKYGADNCGANWNSQALKKAKEYLNKTTISDIWVDFAKNEFKLENFDKAKYKCVFSF